VKPARKGQPVNLAQLDKPDPWDLRARKGRLAPPDRKVILVQLEQQVQQVRRVQLELLVQWAHPG
jgi:hypothetical protein